ncbi:hypothetical protein FHR32_003982 [Streptosporangium album]|uniref:Uncharacterized protein n=1 Tax=Streptosporangium album TaxID=47479 RepID=A0A7W7RX52_9ACTN|nr:hypothetical protein [Streptosporangium album]MBB4939677.1 hypothetical protein [Streptosporangium album]
MEGVSRARRHLSEPDISGLIRQSVPEWLWGVQSVPEWLWGVQSVPESFDRQPEPFSVGSHPMPARSPVPDSPVPAG